MRSGRLSTCRQLRAVVDKFKARADIHVVNVAGDFNSLGMTSTDLERTLGLKKLSCEADTHDSDGCIDHVMSSKAAAKTDCQVRCKPRGRPH